MFKFEIICETETGDMISYIIKASNQLAAVAKLAETHPDDAAAVLEINEI